MLEPDPRDYAHAAKVLERVAEGDDKGFSLIVYVSWSNSRGEIVSRVSEMVTGVVKDTPAVFAEAARRLKELAKCSRGEEIKRLKRRLEELEAEE